MYDFYTFFIHILFDIRAYFYLSYMLIYIIIRLCDDKNIKDYATFL